MRRWPVAVLISAVVLCGCGYVGDPLPPALNIPQRIEDLRAVQVGDRIVVEFTLPLLTTEGLPLTHPGPADVRIGVAPPPFEVRTWADAAKQVSTTQVGTRAVRMEIPVREWLGTEVIIGVRSRNRDRFSDWSNLVALNVVPPLAVPVDLRAESHPQGARIAWRSPDSRPNLLFHVYRTEPKGQERLVGSAVDKTEFVDAQATFGKAYQYRVQAVLDKSLSEFAGPVEVTPRDEFAPAVPAGVISVVGVSAVELTWQRSPDADLKGYRIYRGEAGADLSVHVDLVNSPSFRDRQVMSGQKYRYAISAVDRADNESAKSQIVEVTAP